MATNAVASIQLTANHSQLASGLRSASGIVQNWAKHTRAALAGIAAAPGSALMSLGRSTMALASFAVAKRGLDAMVDMGKSVFDFERKLVRFGIATRQGSGQLAELRKEVRATSTATGVDANVVLDAARAYVDLAGAQNSSIEKMKTLARAGQASEAEGKDLAGMMYQLTRSMKITDDQMEDTMGGLINQAKDGAIEAKQMAAEFAGMMPIFARFGVTGREGALQLGAMYQVTRDGFDSAAQAATGMIRLMAGFQRHASRFKSWGIEVFKPGSKNELRSMADIMAQVHKNPLSKDIEALIKAFGRSEAWRTFELLNESPERLRELEEAGRANGVVAKDLATFTESAAGRMDMAFEKMKNGFANVLTPDRIDQIVSGIESIANAMPAIMTAIGKVSDAFGAFVHAIRKAKHYVMGGSDYKLSSDENYALIAAKSMPNDPVLKAKADVINARKKSYDALMGDLVNEENDFSGPTDNTIKKAITASRSKDLGEALAGRTYLESRDKDISTERYRRLRDEANREDEKERHSKMTPYAITQERYRQAEAEDAARDKAAAQNWEAMKPFMTQVAKQIGQAVSGAINNKPTSTAVHVDGNPVATASGNASNHRRQ